MGIKRYILEDQGQDLVLVDIKGDTIIGVGPFASSSLNKAFVGQLNYDYYAQKKLKRGDYIRYSAGPQDDVKTIKYKIVRVEDVEIKYDVSQEEATNTGARITDEMAQWYDDHFDPKRHFMFINGNTLMRVGG